MSDDILFDNIIITNLKVVADDYAEDSWEIKHQQELLGDGSGVSQHLFTFQFTFQCDQLNYPYILKS